MSLPKAGKANLKTPQSGAGLPMPSSGGGGAGSSPNQFKNLVQQGTQAAGIAKKSAQPKPAPAKRPDTSGRKIQSVIQTGTKASNSK